MTSKTVYLDYDREALDKQYNNRERFSDFAEHFENWKRWSAETRKKIPCVIDVAFGTSEFEKLDIFPSGASSAASFLSSEKNAPILLMIHGGYWYSLDKSDYSFPAEGLTPHGVMMIANNYDLAPHVTMDEIVRQNREAVRWIWNNAKRFGGDPSRLYVCGHSAGAHLAAMLIATDWPSYGQEMPEDVIKGACLIGGIFDLEPIRLSFLNQKLNLTTDDVRLFSPILQKYDLSAPIKLVVAIDESPEFHRQSQEMDRFWRKLGFPSELIVPPGLNHYNVANQLIRADSDLVQMQLDHMKSAFKKRPFDKRRFLLGNL